MADREELLRLADAIEAATDPDREMDGAIDRLLHKRPKDGDYDAAERAIWRVSDGWSGLLVRGDGFARSSFCADEFTASLDAAMLLVPEGWCPLIDCRGDPVAVTLYPPDYDPSDWHLKDTGDGHAATPALALAAASLRARAQDPLRAHGGGK